MKKESLRQKSDRLLDEVLRPVVTELNKCARATPLTAKEETPRTWLNPKKLANDAVQRLADSEPTEDSIEGMERLRGTPQESMFVVNAAELQRVIECTLEDAIYDSRSSQPSSSSEITEAIEDFHDAILLWADAAPSGFRVPSGGISAARIRLESLYLEQLQEIERLRTEASRREQELMGEVRRWQFTYDHEIVAHNLELSAQLSSLASTKGTAEK